MINSQFGSNQKRIKSVKTIGIKRMCTPHDPNLQVGQSQATSATSSNILSHEKNAKKTYRISHNPLAPGMKRDRRKCTRLSAARSLCSALGDSAGDRLGLLGISGRARTPLGFPGESWEPGNTFPSQSERFTTFCGDDLSVF